MRYAITVDVMEFDVGGRTLWVQGSLGTVLRVQLPPGTRFDVEKCKTNRSSHLDLTIAALVDAHPARVCLGEDVVQ